MRGNSARIGVFKSKKTSLVEEVKRYIFALTISLLLPVVCLGALVFERTQADIGFIYRDEPKQIEFTFTNVSTETLTVYDVEPSCDCTTAQITPEVIPPRSPGKVIVFFDPMGYEGRGRVTEYVRLFTNDPENPEVMLTFSVEVGIGPEPEPRSLDFGEICLGEADTLEVAIHPGQVHDFAVLNAWSDTSCVTIEKIGKSDDGSYHFRVVARNEGATGRLSSFVTIGTSDSLRKTIRIPISASLKGHISVEPDVVVFGRVKAGQYIPRNIRVFSDKDQAFRVIDVTSDIDHLEFDIEPVSRWEYSLRIRVKEDAPSGRVMGSIKVVTDCKDEPPLEVRLTGYVKEKQ